MIDMKVLKELAALGEINQVLKSQSNEFIQWAMRIGESRNILNNALIEFQHIRKVMNELEHNIPQFHRQPGLFREFEDCMEKMIGVLGQVNRKLNYELQEDTKTKPFICSECGDEEDDDYDE